MTDYEGKWVFITGGSSGIGLATARRMAQRGAHVCIFARREDVLRQATAEVEAARRSPTQRVEWRVLDVGDDARVQAVMNACVSECGTPAVLINCAGRAVPDYFERITHERFADTLRVNLHGCWSTTSALVPHMKRAGGGYVVNVSSLAGLIGVFGLTDYCASKFALVGFSEALRSELGPHGITVSVLCPPDVDTPGLAEENRHKPRETFAASEGGGMLSADAVADELLRGMARGRFLIVPGGEGKLAYLAKRFVPGLVEWVVNRRIRAVAR